MGPGASAELSVLRDYRGNIGTYHRKAAVFRAKLVSTTEQCLRHPNTVGEYHATQGLAMADGRT